jgi:hypothetical protein
LVIGVHQDGTPGTSPGILEAEQQPSGRRPHSELNWDAAQTDASIRDDDRRSGPGAERQFAARMGASTVEVPSSHVAMVSHPADVVDLIETAAQTFTTDN